MACKNYKAEMHASLEIVYELNNDIVMDNIIHESNTNGPGLRPGTGAGPPIFGSSVTQDLTTIVSFMREDEDHLVFKRFERLNLYNLLYLQHRLTVLDQEIALYEESHDARALAAVLPKLEPLMKSYNDALLSQNRLRSLPLTPRHLASNLKAHSEYNLVELKHELDPEAGWSEVVSLSTTQKGWIHKFIDRHYRLQKFFRKHGPNEQRSSILIYSEKAVRRTEQALLNVSFCILVLGPIFVLSFIAGKAVKLALVFGSVLATSLLASILPDNSQKSSLALVAGYTAILVVFVSNNVGTA